MKLLTRRRIVVATPVGAPPPETPASRLRRRRRCCCCCSWLEAALLGVSLWLTWSSVTAQSATTSGEQQKAPKNTTNTSSAEDVCFVTGRPPAHVATALTARYVPGLRPGDPSCCSPCEAYDVAVRWTNASVAAIWRTFDDRRRETQPGAPLLLDIMDDAQLEKSTVCSQLSRYPRCVGHATAFLATAACLPGAARFAGSSRVEEGGGGGGGGTSDAHLPTSVNASAAAAAAAVAVGHSSDVTPPHREIRMSRSVASDMFDSCREVKIMGFTTVEAWFGQAPDDFIEIITGGAKYTTPQLGDVDTVITDDCVGDCYTTPPGAFRPDDPWMKGGGWCCDGFPPVKECEGEMDYASYARVIGNTYADSLRRRGICPDASPAAP